MKFTDRKLIAIAQQIDKHNWAIRNLMAKIYEGHPEFYEALEDNQFGTPTWAEHVVLSYIDQTKWKYEDFRFVRISKATGEQA